MRYSRQSKILELIASHNVETQDELAALLNEGGYKVTQATVSRDIKDLKLVKTLDSDGKYKYASTTPINQKTNERFLSLLKDTLVSVGCSDNIIVVKTLSGCANAACEAIDVIQPSNILGTIAGENTIFIVCSNRDGVPGVVKYLNDIIQSR